MSKSVLPDGGYTLTHGSNYMLDGFQFDTEYNGGVLEKARLPEAKGLSALPSGMIPMDSAGQSGLPDGVEVDSQMDLDLFTKESSVQLPTIIDHDWLASNPIEDFSGQRTHDEVMEMYARGESGHPEANQLKTLEQSWGRRTTGLDIVPNQAEKVKARPQEEVSVLPQDLVYEKKAFRRLAYGEPISRIVEEENVSSRLAQELQREYGLNGRVYIRASDFPGLFNGRWNEVINKKCASSMFIIADSDCAFDRYLGMSVVASVKQIPWNQVHNNLMPKLESCGVSKISSDSVSTLKQAFIDLTEGRVISSHKTDTWFHIAPDDTEGLSLKSAMDSLSSSEIDTPYIGTYDERVLTAKEEKLKIIASKLVSEGFIEQEIVDAVITDKTSNERKLERLYEIASKPVKSSSYEGSGSQVKAHVSEYKKEYAPLVDPNKKHTALENRKALEQTKELIRLGHVTVEEVTKLTKNKRTASSKLQAIVDYVNNKANKSAEYKGAEFVPHQPKTASVSVKDPNLIKVSSWLRSKMTEGSVGNEIDQMMRARFSSELIENYSDEISETRKAHEGLSGHIYVDSEVYMTDKGSTGCDKGALVHRANNIPTVLKSANCGTCVFNSGGSCQKYAKPLIASVSEVLEDANSYQKENIRLANGSDADRTASLFVNNYDPSEFGLSSEGTFALNESASTEQLKDVLFGGFEV